MAGAFDGASHLEAASAVVSAAPFTMNCWFNVTALAANQSMVSVSDASAVNHYWFTAVAGNIGGDPVRASAAAGGGAAAADTSAAPGAGAWHMATYVETAANDRDSYLDGGNVGSDATNLAPTNVDVTTIGAWTIVGTQFNLFTGSIGEVAIWDVALTTDELAQLAAGFSALFIRPGDLVVYHPIWGGNLTVPMIGPTFVNNGVTDAADHPAIYYPASPFMTQRSIDPGRIFTPTYRRRRIA